MNSVNIKIDNKTLIRVMVVIVVFLGAIKFFSSVQAVLTWIVVAIFLALALNPAVSWLTKKLPGRKDKRGMATGIAYLMIITVLGAFLYLVVPPIVSQTSDFVDDIPSYTSELRDPDSFLGKRLDQYGLSDEVDDFFNDVPSYISNVRDPAIKTAQSIVGTVVAVLTILIMTFMMLVEGPDWLRWLARLQPESKRKHREELAYKMYNIVTGYVNGQLIIATIGGLSALVAMLIVGIPNAVALAVIVGVFALIPMIGATLGSLIVVIMALFSSLSSAIILGIFFVVYQQIENQAIQPVIQSKSLGLTPLTVIISALIGVSAGGFLGGFLAIPLAGCIRVLLLDWADKKGLSKPKPQVKTA